MEKDAELPTDVGNKPARFWTESEKQEESARQSMQMH